MPWNKGRIVGQKRPLKPVEIQSIRAGLKETGTLRDRVMFDLALDAKLRACDFVRLRIDDLIAGGLVKERASVLQRKTKRPVQFEITPRTAALLKEWVQCLARSSCIYLFPGRYESHLSTRQYARCVTKWIQDAGLRKEAYATHTMRRTKVSIMYRATGNLRAAQLLLGHSSIASTIHYLGVDVEDALMLSEQILT